MTSYIIRRGWGLPWVILIAGLLAPTGCTEKKAEPAPGETETGTPVQWLLDLSARGEIANTLTEAQAERVIEAMREVTRINDAYLLRQGITAEVAQARFLEQQTVCLELTGNLNCEELRYGRRD